MTLPTNNAEWGFFGTIRHHADQTESWELAMAVIQTTTGCPDVAVRHFLDSTHGRYFADDVANGLFADQTLAAAIGAAVIRWMRWRINRRTAHDTGIPYGLSYLTGFVTHFEILGDAA